MTGIDRRGDTPMGPPWPVDVLADLHAGALDPAVSDDLWPRVRHDPDALAVLAALDATRAELAGVAARPAPPMPEHLAARLDAAVAAEARTAFRPPAPPPVAPPTAPVVDLAKARKRRNQRWGWAAGALAAAAAVAVVVIAVPRGGSPVTGEAAAPPQQLTAGQLNGATLASALGRSDYGPLSDQGRRSACLTANHVTGQPVGGMRVTLNGEPGVLMVLTTGQTARYRLLVVGRNCAAGTPDELANVVVGGLPAPTR
ncbi:MAG TPA: hypothetical protein VFW65_06140 [Pseudonocardiaceae bacterium]|nr:hypothetical protein [Pseudonocardiaceae bacterium]